MICDWDDHMAENDALPWMLRLKEENPAFKATLFAVPSQGSAAFWASTPPWLELAVHGWAHPDPHECEHWGVARMRTLMDEPIVKEFFVRGFKAPGWQISEGCYAALLERDWWVADQSYNDARRPKGLRVHRLGDGDHWHGHVQDVCGNGLAETWDQVVQLVREADSFQFVSEVVK